MIRRTRRANTIIEVALTLPLFAAMLAGVLEWGLALPRQSLVEHCARDAARAGAMTQTADDPIGAATARARARLVEAGLDADSAAIGAEIVSSDAGNLMSVEINVPYTQLLGMIPTTAALKGTARMRMENQ